jgi:sulfane dehydrogenase subunit SoxC
VSISLEELQLAARNHGMPLEALHHEITPLGLHYLLIHYDIPVVDPASWRLTVGGRVERELELSLEDLRSREAVTAAITMECAGNGRAQLEPHVVSQPWLAEAVGTAEWTGIPLGPLLLAEAGLAADALEVVFTGLDRGVEGGVEQLYERSLSLADAENGLLAYACNGEPLPPQHGFPLRLLVPGWYGMTSVKWLQRITVVSEPFDGYQMVTGYRMRRDEDDPGTPVTRIEPRSLMVPPGIPDFMTRKRFLSPGPVRLEGRAWSGWGPIERVEVSVDGGEWTRAELGAPPGAAAWTPWWLEWDAAEGEHELRVRATDATGRSQPDAPPWNVGGYANNAVQRVPVNVTAA